jgi:hypothetical protein
MMAVDKATRFPKTNREYFRYVIVRGLILSGISFLVIFILGKALTPYHGWRGDEFLRTAAVSVLIGFNLTLVYLRWLKRQDEKDSR